MVAIETVNPSSTASKCNPKGWQAILQTGKNTTCETNAPTKIEKSYLRPALFSCVVPAETEALFLHDKDVATLNINAMLPPYAKSFLTFLINEAIVPLSDISNAIAGDNEAFEKCISGYQTRLENELMTEKKKVITELTTLLTPFGYGDEIQYLAKSNSNLNMNVAFCNDDEDRFGENSEWLGLRLYIDNMPTVLEIDNDTFSDTELLAFHPIIEKLSINAVCQPPSCQTESLTERYYDESVILDFSLRLSNHQLDDVLVTINQVYEDNDYEELPAELLASKLSCYKISNDEITAICSFVEEYSYSPLDDYVRAVRVEEFYQKSLKLEDAFIELEKSQIKLLEFLANAIKSPTFSDCFSEFYTEGLENDLDGHDPAIYRSVVLSKHTYQYEHFTHEAEMLWQDEQNEALGLAPNKQGIEFLKRQQKSELLLLALNLFTA
ncbi:hypothetical protein [Photobacterium sp. GB-72]|uniref:hypothetical protein n=1 Tax=Photobacterium sp. GB-72 TaxID=2022105 RepID=UPI000D161E1A|nr:hypothetical protein [Photobacterium sp. GB-72]PSV28054.1 hypothetical protein C9J40_19435 [Photobacterium sp. GB-72]